jgi:Putative zinc-finger
MNCSQARSLISLDLDQATTGAERHHISAHVSACPDCAREYAQLEQVRNLVSGLGRKAAPPELALQLQVALSQAAAQSFSSRLEGFEVRFTNALKTFMFPATAGLVSAMLCFGVLIGLVATPLQVQASSSDELPLMLYTPPQLSATPFMATVGNMDGSLVVETYVDARGRVQDYRIISAPEGTAKLLPQLDNMMIFTTFRPAMNLGRPIPSHVVISFSGVNVKG